jgi:hypothetical protein
MARVQELRVVAVGEGREMTISPAIPSPFLDLPGALVEEVLQRTNDVGRGLLDSFEHVRRERETLREQLRSTGLLRRDNDLEYPPIPTCCGIDGSYAVERLLTTDFAACAAVAVEGLTPPSEKRFWEQPRHQVLVEAETHQEFTGGILRSVMMCMELDLAVRAPHDVIFLDGSVSTPAIYLNQSLSRADEAPELRVAKLLLSRVEVGLKAYAEVLASQRADKCWVFVPKYSTQREIGRKLEWPESFDDRGLLSALLEAGEFTAPATLQPPKRSAWHIGLGPVAESARQAASDAEEKISAELARVSVIYYKPHSWLPALRLETGFAVVENRSRLAGLLHAVKHQCGTPAILEPFPLYLADRMVKSLARAMPTFRQAATQSMAESYSGSLDDIFHGMHGYRTEAGA